MILCKRLAINLQLMLCSLTTHQPLPSQTLTADTSGFQRLRAHITPQRCLYLSLTLRLHLHQNHFLALTSIEAILDQLPSTTVPS